MSDELLARCDDFHQVRGNISQFQATLNQILSRTPTVAEYKHLMKTYGSDDSLDSWAPNILEKLRMLLHSPQMKVAVRLRSLYDKGYLPFLLGMSKINFKSNKCDRYVGYLLDYTPTKSLFSDIYKEQKDKLNEGTQDIEMYPPSLPPILDPLLLKLVLTDKSLRLPKDMLENFELLHTHLHNRKLALSGGALLNYVLIEIIEGIMPNAHEDDVVYLKSRLTSTHVLAKLAYTYNLPEAIEHNVSTEMPVEDKLVIFKNVFLAYVGALVQDKYSVTEIRTWVQSLVKPFLSRLEAQKNSGLKNQYEVAYAELQFLLARVNSYVQEPTKKIHWDFQVMEEIEDAYAFRLIVGGLALAVGTGSDFLTAKRRAVYFSLKDKNFRSALLDLITKDYRLPEKSSTNAEAKSESKTEETNSLEMPDDKYEPSDANVEKAKPTLPTGPKNLVFKSQPPSGPAGPRMPLPYGKVPALPNRKV